MNKLKTVMRFTIVTTLVLLLSFFGDVAAKTDDEVGQDVEKIINSIQGLGEEIDDTAEKEDTDSAEGMLGDFASPTRRSRQMAELATIQLRALQEIQSMNDINPLRLKADPRHLRIWKQKFNKYCSGFYEKPECNESAIYREADGACNNLNNPLWGAAFSPEMREIAPMYEDGIDAPRLRGQDGEPLPSARRISNVVHKATGKSPRNPNRTVMVMQWGQFIDHEFVATPVLKDVDGSTLHCCEPKNKDRPECLPIDIPVDDPYFTKTCMGFVRSAPALNEHCNPGFREQINQVTSFIDGSAVYGSTEEQTTQLRKFVKGEMKTLPEFPSMLPKTTEDQCRLPMAGDYCQYAGDARVNVVPSLGLCHTMFVREHNRIASAVYNENPHWDDETTFQETRRILAAIIQHINYNEYVPAIMNSDTIQQYSLSLRRDGYRNCYNDKINPTIANEFAAAAFRFGHSQIPDYQAQMSKNYKTMDKSPIEFVYHTPHMVTVDGGRALDGLARWLIDDPTPLADGLFEPGTRDKLFLDSKNVSLDLPALNIQRGRDHGLPGYNYFRAHCKLEPAQMTADGSFVLPDHVDDQRDKLHTVYRHVNDIDLFTGAMTETLLPNSSVGPTFSCLLGRQFRRLKNGDRFWYETARKGIRFTKGQLAEIRKITLARLLCNCFDIVSIQPVVMTVPGPGNERVPCDQIPRIDFGQWRSCRSNVRPIRGPQYNLNRCK